MSNNGTLIRLPLKNVRNCRDLGGYPTPSGSTAFKRFVRSAELSNITPQETDVLIDYGIKTILDLRSPEEVKALPNPLSKDSRFNVLNYDLLPRTNAEETFLQSHLSRMALDDLYIHILGMNARIGEVLRIIDLHDDGTVLFHCSAGKDRTGIIAMLLLSLAGVDDTDILSNYQVSFTYLDQSVEALKKVPANLLDSKPEYMIRAMDYLRTNYGSIEAYLITCGVDERIQRRLIQRITV